MDWSKGWESRVYASFIDKVSWKDLERFEITGGRVSRSTSGLLESADIETTNYRRGEERWIRVWMDARQMNAVAHVPLFTGLATSPKDNKEGNYYTRNTLECYSVLKPLQDILLPRGWYAPKDFGASIVHDLLAVTPAPHVIAENMPTLKQHIIAEKGENHLTMLYKILSAIDWRIRISGDGTIYIEPYPQDAVVSFSSNNDVLEPETSTEYDWFDCPNVFRATSGNDIAIARDEDSDSQFSIQSRGREIWAEELDCNLNNGETLYEYALRQLRSRQMVAEAESYTRRFNPNVTVGDLIRLNYPNIQGVYFVIAQSIDLADAGKTAEEVVR